MVKVRSRKRALLGLTIFVGTALGIGLGIGIAGEKYPEIGDEITGDARKKYTEWIDCAIKQLPGTPGKKLKHCKGKGKDVKVHKPAKKPKHWKHGTPGTEKDEISRGFAPHATPENLKKCKLCLVVNPKWICPWIDCAKETGADGKPTARAIYCTTFLKGFFRHEAVHWVQYNDWDLWQISNEDLFNCPYKEGESPEGKNGNPKKKEGNGGDRPPDDRDGDGRGGDGRERGPDGEQDPETDEQKADKLARKLYDQFDKARSEVTEMEAVVFGNLRGGCVDTKTGKEYWEGKDGKPSYMETLCKAMHDEKKKLFELAAEAKKKTGDAYKKVRKFAEKICKAKKKMCEKVDELDEAKKKAKKKWQTQDWKQDEDEGNGGDGN